MNNRSIFFSGYLKNFLNKPFWMGTLLLMAAGIWNGCTATDMAFPTEGESGNLENRMVKALRSHSSALRQLKAQIDTLQQELKDSERLKRNQNILLLDLEKKFNEQTSQLERKLEQQKLKMRKQEGEMERLNKNYREIRLAFDQSNPAKTNSVPPPSANSNVAAPKPSPKETPDATTPPASNVADADQLFESGWELFKAEQYLQSIEILQKLRKNYPKHPNAIEAHYLIGDAYYSMQNFQSAAIELHDFVQQNPQYPSVFDAQWKLAQSLEKSEEIGLALEIYQNITQSESPYRENALARIKFYESQ
ncbi:MAG: tetratricopeptide repeat protein [SAR324 cluster bacterium]|nr:tetratricopeptide repeat protein [SAR324 cluster bacterium]